MVMKSTTYKLRDFYQPFNNSEKLKLRFTNLASSICRDIEDITFISKYLSKMNNQQFNEQR